MHTSFSKLVFTIIAGLIFLAQPVSADETTKRIDIIHLLKITGSLKIADQMAVATYQQMAQMMKKANPKIPQDALAIVEKEAFAFMRGNMEGVLLATVPVYDQNFSHGEIKDIIAFYKTETGQKAIRVMPQMVQQSMMIAQQYFGKLMPQFQQQLVTKLQAAGYE